MTAPFHRKAPMIFPGYKGGDPSDPFSIRLPEIISEEQFNAELQALFERDPFILKLERERNKLIKEEIKDAVRIGDSVDRMRAKVKEWTREYQRVQRRLNYYKAMISKAQTRAKGYHRYRPVKPTDTKIR